DLGVDRTWAEFLGWLRTQGASAIPNAPKVLPRCGYGWANGSDQMNVAQHKTSRTSIAGQDHFSASFNCYKEQTSILKTLLLDATTPWLSIWKHYYTRAY